MRVWKENADLYELLSLLKHFNKQRLFCVLFYVSIYIFLCNNSTKHFVDREVKAVGIFCLCDAIVLWLMLFIDCNLASLFFSLVFPSVSGFLQENPYKLERIVEEKGKLSSQVV